MIRHAARRPYLQRGEIVTTDYDCEWLVQVLREAAEETGEHIPCEWEIAQGILLYLEHYCPLHTLPLEYFFARLRNALRELGLPRIADALEQQLPPVSIALDDIAWQNPLPLFFYANLSQKINDLQRMGLTSYRFSGAFRCSLMLGKRRRACPTQKYALQELKNFIDSMGN